MIKATTTKLNTTFVSQVCFGRTLSMSCIMASPQDVERLQGNSFYSKYLEKLKKRQINDPEEFHARVVELEKRKQNAAEEAKATLKEQAKKAKESKCKLENVMKMDLLGEKSADEISEIWNHHYKSKDSLFAVIPADEYQSIAALGKEFPTFVYPVPRNTGYEFFVQQFEGNFVHFTPLISFQAHKENAPSCLSLLHFTELSESKGIVLMSGEPDLNIISINEAQLLAMQVKMYYGLQGALKVNLLRMFNKSPDSFRYMDLVAEFEKCKKDWLDRKL